MDRNENIAKFGHQDASELIARKKAGERTVLDDGTAGYSRDRVQRVFAPLDEAHAGSGLPGRGAERARA